MKAEDVEPGQFKAGHFVFSIQKPVFVIGDTDFFEVLLTQKKDGFLYYVHIVEDTRFDFFGHLRTFTKKLTEYDLIEYNSYVSTVFHKSTMPTFKLHRHSIVELVERCKKMKP